MKEQYPKAVPSITIGRALAFTEVTQKYPDLPANLRIAKSFRRACETTPMLIQPDEPIVRHPCGKPRAGAFSPDISWDWLESELDTIAARPQDPYYIREEDKKVIRTKLFPLWKGKSLSEACDVELKRPACWTMAASMAASESDPTRKAELLNIAEVNAKVPAHPPETFVETLQSIWAIQSLQSLEASQCSTSPGRVDQYLYPYFQKDTECGRITPQDAFELFSCFMPKCSLRGSSTRPAPLRNILPAIYPSSTCASAASNATAATA